MIASYLVEAGQFIEQPLVKLVALLLIIWVVCRFSDWLWRA